MKANKNELLKKHELLNTVICALGFENTCTIELFRMYENGARYKDMMEYYNLYLDAMNNDFFGFDD